MEVQSQSSEHEEQKKLMQLEKIRESVDATTDKLGHPIEPGIKDAVILLTALDFRTTQSCEGHVDWGVGIPWVEIASVLRDNPEEDELKLAAEKLSIQKRAHNLLKEFYASKGIENYDQILHLKRRGWGFEIDSNITSFDESLSSIDPENREEMKALCERELKELKEFMQEPENLHLAADLEYNQPLPENEDWFQDRERVDKLHRSMLEAQAKTHALLRQFYGSKGMDPNSYDRLLAIDLGGHGFRIQSTIEELHNLLSVEQRKVSLPDYQNEMQEFTEFLREKFMNSRIIE